MHANARSERESKTLRAEVDSHKDKVAALRTQLAGMQARRQAERELAAKKTREVCAFGNIVMCSKFCEAFW